MPATREDLVLVLADGAQGGDYALDPVRLMKACFITAMAAPEADWRSMFSFHAYDYGPFDSGVYVARDALISRSLLTSERPGRYEQYSLTDSGRVRVAELEDELDADHLAWLRRVGAWVASRSFSRLLDEVYARWPEYATNSIRW
jgi:hypothetical protein